MTDLSDLEKLAQRYLEYLLDEQDVRFRERRFMDDEKRKNAEYHAEQTGGYRQWIKRDEWGNGSFLIRHQWPDGWAQRKTNTPEYEELSRLVLRAQLQFHLIMYDRFVGAPEAEPTDVLFSKIETKHQKETPAPTLSPRRRRGRPGMARDKIIAEFRRREIAGELPSIEGGWRETVCRDIASWYESEHGQAYQAKTFKKHLKQEFDRLERG